MEKDLKKEKSEKEKIKNNLDNIKKEKNSLENNLQKEKSLTSQLNSKMDQLEKEKNNLKNEIQDLNSDLNSEKNKNVTLNNKLDNISSENNKNIKIVLEQVKNEQIKNQNLGSKISELEKKEKQQIMYSKELEKSIKKKEQEIQNLSINNKNLGKNVELLKQNLNIKENKIKEVNDILIKEKNINQNISQNLNTEKEKNKKLNDKLDNIASKNNENVYKILEQLDNEKKVNQNLQSKYSQLEKKEKEKNLENKELEIQLKKKNEELEDVIKNYIPENFGLKFQSDCKTGEYDLTIDINSLKGLIKKGWIINYNKKDGKKKYLEKKEEKTIVVGVIGNGNKGKTFILEKLSGYKIPKGFNVKTIGLSIRYGSSPEHNIAILDSAGQETPLLKAELDSYVEENIDKNEIINEENQKNANSYNKKLDNNEKNKKGINNNIDQQKKNDDLNDEKDIEFEQYSRDKLITEYFIQKFIIYKSDVLILVVGNISLTEQKLLYLIKKEVKILDKNKQIFVIHNLKEYSTEEQVNDYIENTLKKLCKTEIEENTLIKAINSNDKDIDDKFKDINKFYFNKYFIEKDENVSHFIFINDFSEKANYYNIPTITHIQKEIEVIKKRNKFSIIEDVKQFLVDISEEIMEQNPKIENIITVEGEKYDKILLKNINEITLKSYAVNEVGLAFRNDNNEPKYSCYIDPEENKLYISIELPGGGNIKRDLSVEGNFYYFIFEGVKYGDKKLEEDEKNEIKKLKKQKCTRKTCKFKFLIKIPCGLIQIILEPGKQLKTAGKLSDANKDGKNGDRKGVYTFEYDISINNQKKDKENEEILEL